MALIPNVWRNWSAGLFATLVFGAASLSACAPDVPQDPAPPTRVSPIYDPVTAVVPLPNNAGIDAEGTLSDLPSIGEENAEGEFARWLTQFHGWLPETPIEVPFNGELDTETLNTDTVKLYELTESGLKSLELADVAYRTSALGSVVTIVPKEPLKPNTNYGALVTTAVKDTSGNNILPDSVSFTAMNRTDIIDPESGKVTLPELADPDSRSTAESLQGLHQTLKPLINGLESEGVISRKEVAVAFTWKTLTDSVVVLDPATATLPLPNTIALESDGTFPAAALPALVAYNQGRQDFMDGKIDTPPVRTAQVYFDQYLDKLHGWPNAASSLPVELPISGDIDPATITDDSVQLWKFTADGAERVEGTTVSFVEAPEGNKISIQLGSDLEYGADYFAFATRDLKNKAGLPLQPPAALAMAMQPYDVVDGEGKSTASRVSDEQAVAIAGVQATIKPAMEYLRNNTELDHTKLAAVWSFYTWKDPFAVFEPTQGDIPFPNAFLIGDDGTANLPTTGANGLQLALLTELNKRSGFSVLGNGWISIIGELDPATVKLQATRAGDGSVALATVDGLPQLLTDDDIEFVYNKEHSKLYFKPKRSLPKSTLHAGIVSNEIKGINGLPLMPTAIFVFLASPRPLVDENGKSTVAQLTDELATQLEAARQQYEPLFTGAKIATGDNPEDIAVAFAFTTDDTTSRLQQLRARAMAKLGDAPLRASSPDNAGLVTNDGNWATYNGPYSGGTARDFSNVEIINWKVEIDTFNYYNALGQPVPFDMLQTAKIPVSVFVPKTSASCSAPFKTVIANHGLGGWRVSSGWTFANELAANCIATVAIDLPRHGGRVPSGGDLHPTERPMNSGANFIGADLIGTAANFSQASADVMTVARVIRDGGLDEVVGGNGVFDADGVGLVGISLGGAVGQLAVTLDPHINVATLNVPPGKLTYFLSEPSNIGAGILEPLGMLGIMPGTFAFEQLLSLAQWLGDVVDPQAFAAFTTNNTLEVLEYFPNGKDGDANIKYAPAEDANKMPITVPPAQMMVQMAKGDMTTPNVGTIALAEALGVSLDNTSFDAPHGFIGGDTAAARCAVLQVAAWLSSGLSTGTAALPQNLNADTCVNAQ